MTYSLAWPGKARENQSKVDYGGKYPACCTQTETNPLQFSLKSCTGGTEIKGTRNHLSSTQQPNYHWRTNPVIAPKLHNPGAIRFCSDMRVPNTAILRPVTEALTVEDIKFKHEGATVFSVLNMNEGYHQLEFDESSKHMTTFYGTECKMSYTRLNYGTISSQDIFDKAMDDTISGLQGVLHIRNDFIVFGMDNTEHDRALENLSNDSENVVSPSAQRNANFVYLRLKSSDFCFQKME